MKDWEREARSEEKDMPAEELEDPRVRFSAERTLLAWIRTSLAMMGFGFVVARFGLFLREVESFGRMGTTIRQPGLSLWIGTGLIVLGVAVNILSVIEYLRVLRRIERGQAYQPPKFALGVAVAVGLVLLGLAIIVYLIRLLP